VTQAAVAGHQVGLSTLIFGSLKVKNSAKIKFLSVNRTTYFCVWRNNGIGKWRSWREIVQVCFSVGNLQPRFSPVATGGWGLSPPKQSSNPIQLVETWNTINQLRFCQFLECQAPPHKAKAPRRNANPPYWKLSGDGSAQIVGLNCKLEWISASRQATWISYKSFLFNGRLRLTFAVIDEKVISTRNACKRCCSHFDKLESWTSVW